MAEERAEPREATWRGLVPWTELFRTFQVALDLNKLLLAAAGIVLMAFGWWLLALVFSTGYDSDPPSMSKDAYALALLTPAELEALPPAKKEEAEAERKKAADAWRTKIKPERDDWNLMHAAAGVGRSNTDYRYEPADVADTFDDFVVVRKYWEDKPEAERKALGRETIQKDLVLKGIDADKAGRFARLLGREKPDALLATWPWGEDRGPNPFLMATGQVSKPWETGQFWEWFSGHQAPVLVEPLVKFLRPVIYFFSPRAGGLARFYFLLVLLWALAVWSVFGGAITRIAAVQIARGEKIGLMEALRFTFRRLMSYVMAPLFPLAFVFLLLVLMCLFGLFYMIPVVGDVLVGGLWWWLMLLLGGGMAFLLIGLVGWPLMAASVSTEGTDSWEAVSRSFSYVFTRPWQYIWYSAVAIVYGAAVIFFVGFFASFLVYLSKWGVSQTPFVQRADREPSFLFVYAPTSFHWRDLLLEGATVDKEKVVQDGQVNRATYERYLGAAKDGKRSDDALTWYNRFGAALVAFWVGLFFLLVLGFGYSFFWCASTIIYLLLRKSVDAAELDEVYLEEDDLEGQYGGPLTQPTPAPTPAPRPSGAPLTMVEPPTLRPQTPAPAPAPDATQPAPTPPPEPATKLAEEKPVAPPPEPARGEEPPRADADKPADGDGAKTPE
jgi:hypothetical protein